MNRLAIRQEWEFYELLISSLIVSTTVATDKYTEEFTNYDAELIKSRSSSEGFHYLNVVLNKLAQQYKVCILLDEFDETYQYIPSSALKSLGILRDTNNNRLSYILFLRDLPEKLRDPSDAENFYSMFSGSPLVIGPYSFEDTKIILQRIESRREYNLLNEQREWVYFNSGGHPGLILSLYSLLADGMIQENHLEDLMWIAKQNVVYEECRNIWQLLSEDERYGVTQYVNNHNITSPVIYKSLLVKGILGHPGGSNEKIFSPIFHSFVSEREHLGAPQKEWERVYGRPLRAFLSYASEDKEKVTELNKQLKSVIGIDPWYDREKIFPGDEWGVAIGAAIKKCDVVLVCLSRKSITKEGYFQKEIKLALDVADEKPEDTIFIIPIKLEECNVPSRLSKWHWVNYFEDNAYDKLLVSLKRRAQALLSSSLSWD
jgi:hypothetical protein